MRKLGDREEEAGMGRRGLVNAGKDWLHGGARQVKHCEGLAPPAPTFLHFSHSQHFHAGIYVYVCIGRN